MTDKIVVLSTCASEEEAARIGHLLVEASLAACVNIIPRMRSIFRWDGAVQTSEECLLVIKSSRALFDSLRLVLEQAHSYEVPEAIAFPVVDSSLNYMNWLDNNLRKPAGGDE